MTPKRRRGGDAGAELIELAMVMPILLFVFAAIIDFGFLFQRYEVLTNAAREGARLGVLPGYTVPDVQARVQNYLNAAGLSTASAINVTPAVETVGTNAIAVLTVEVQYESPFSLVGPIAGMVGGSGWSSMTLKALSTMRVEGAATGS